MDACVYKKEKDVTSSFAPTSYYCSASPHDFTQYSKKTRNIINFNSFVLYVLILHGVNGDGSRNALRRARVDPSLAIELDADGITSHQQVVEQQKPADDKVKYDKLADSILIANSIA